MSSRRDVRRFRDIGALQEGQTGHGLYIPSFPGPSVTHVHVGKLTSAAFIKPNLWVALGCWHDAGLKHRLAAFTANNFRVGLHGSQVPT